MDLGRSTANRPSHRTRAALCAACLAAAVGCATSNKTNTPRTALEQLLVSNAVDQSLNKIDFRPLAGRKVFLDAAFVDCVDKNYVIAATRGRILHGGARLVAKVEEAEVIVELRAGGVGTDQTEAFVGLPALSVPGPMPLSTPEVKVWSRSTQTGTAKIGLVAYEAGSRRILGSGGDAIAKSDDSKTYLFGMGPYESGTVRTEVAVGVGRRVADPTPHAVALAPPSDAEPSKLQLAGSEADAPGKAHVDPIAAEKPAAAPAAGP